MGFFANLMNGKAKHYKVYRKCNTCEDTGVIVVSSKSGRDFIKLSKDNPISLMEEVYGVACEKCVLFVDEIPLEDLKKAKKTFRTKDVE